MCYASEAWTTCWPPARTSTSWSSTPRATPTRVSSSPRPPRRVPRRRWQLAAMPRRRRTDDNNDNNDNNDEDNMFNNNTIILMITMMYSNNNDSNMNSNNNTEEGPGRHRHDARECLRGLRVHGRRRQPDGEGLYYITYKLD